MREIEKCDYCQTAIFTNKEVKIWSEIYGCFFHNRCIELAMEASRKYRNIKDIVQDTVGKGFLCITDVWHCDICGGRSGSYGVEKCRHCGAKAHYGSNNGHYTTTDRIMKEAEEIEYGPTT